MYKFLFGGHGTEKNAELLIQKIKDIDILYHESLSRDEGIREDVQTILDKIHEYSPEQFLFELYNYLPLYSFGITFYKKMKIDEELSKVKIILQERPTNQRMKNKDRIDETCKQYNEGIITKLETIEKLIPLYKKFIPLEVERETNLIDDLIKLNNKFQNKKIGVFMGIDHCISVPYICKLKGIDIEIIELKKRSYSNETSGNLKIDYMKGSAISKEKIIPLINNLFVRC